MPFVAGPTPPPHRRRPRVPRPAASPPQTPRVAAPAQPQKRWAAPGPCPTCGRHPMNHIIHTSLTTAPILAARLMHSRFWAPLVRNRAEE